MKLFKTYLIIFLSIFFFNSSVNTAETDIYKKIDLFGEVLEKINKEYVDEINPVSYTHLTLPTTPYV